ncbi:glutathione S-transferase [Oceanicola sp. 22II-s10i]|uniref:glutathione S-transferase n=1 Tax=Oceanicola sp. 22II-s10i TaxID=1317116 RepID=UPI000B51F92A|nr:glutathione S-transferase [Oceanicola sp. 22II-s10i]OWU86062.1 glutathione S-transferase [Oceanicola sp. 22II-s10i]
MKLFSSNASPYVRKVRVVIREAGLTDQVQEDPTPTNLLESNEGLIAVNPLARIPALTRDDGPALYDSRVICRYLDAKGGSNLYPEARIWDVLTLEATADGILDSAVTGISYEKRLRPPEKVMDEWMDAHWEKVARAVKVVNDRWMSHLAGPVDMGHIAMGCALAYLDFRHDERGWRKGCGALDDWFAAFNERQSMKDTAPS